MTKASLAVNFMEQASQDSILNKNMRLAGIEISDYHKKYSIPKISDILVSAYIILLALPY